MHDLDVPSMLPSNMTHHIGEKEGRFDATELSCDKLIRHDFVLILKKLKNQIIKTFARENGNYTGSSIACYGTYS